MARRVAAVVLFLCGCGQQAPTIILSQDGQFQLAVQDGMQPVSDLIPDANLQAGNQARELYVVVLTEAKSTLAEFDDDMTLVKYQQTTLPRVLELVEADTAEPPEVSSDETRPGPQFEIHGTIDGVQIGYLITFVDTGDHFHLILAWTLEERFTQHSSMLREISASLRIADQDAVAETGSGV